MHKNTCLCAYFSNAKAYFNISLRFSTRGGVSWQIQHLASPHAVFTT